MFVLLHVQDVHCTILPKAGSSYRKGLIIVNWLLPTIIKKHDDPSGLAYIRFFHLSSLIPWGHYLVGLRLNRSVFPCLHVSLDHRLHPPAVAMTRSTRKACSSQSSLQNFHVSLTSPLFLSFSLQYIFCYWLPHVFLQPSARGDVDPWDL